ncbi:ECF transporter S component [Actinopolymorpha rutila]|uniref:Energy-coupling factor transport system substrate-specific component n=1 Tax=Actinopolymorpha rutila TaxID=446787 RepID=A0A852ZI56_9ACTN|nr:ECF transporter S component [Actinopolymorpha rutila]NYH91933.1 energy-coupling factor transport system substrate-specific component [Actinopolymorpha rutila]
MSASTSFAPVRLRPRSTLVLLLASAVGLAGFGWPFLVATPAGTGASHGQDAAYLFVALLPLLLGLVWAELGDGGMDVKAVAMLGVLAAAGAGLQTLSPGTGGFDPAFFLLVVAGRVFGPGFGFALGVVAMLATSLLTGGAGPWLPFQMIGLAWVGLLAGCLPAASGWAERGLLAAYAGLSGFGYGALLNLWFWPAAAYLPNGAAYVPGASLGTNLHHYAVFYATTSLGWDTARALLGGVLVLVAGRPVLATLRRAGRRAAFTAGRDSGTEPG